jgi:hypothetical protein
MKVVPIAIVLVVVTVFSMPLSHFFYRLIRRKRKE